MALCIDLFGFVYMLFGEDTLGQFPSVSAAAQQIALEDVFRFRNYVRS